MLAHAAEQFLDRSDRSTVRYVELAPPAALAAWVEAIALVETPHDVPRRTWQLVPDARARVRLPLGRGQQPTILPSSVSPATLNGLVPGPAVMIRFVPWATGALELDGAEVRDSDGWWSGAAAAWEPPAWLTAAARYRSACDWLGRVLPPGAPDARVAAAWTRLARGGTDTGIAAVAGSVGCSPRSLLRSFRRTTGCTPSQARDIERLRRALRLLRSDLELSWTRAALDAGYCDQSHFNRAFARWVGIAPSRFFGEGHHHVNDVFAGLMVTTVDGLAARAMGTPVIRRPFPLKLPKRHRRRLGHR
jgi:AraC-like DNA-binding protein